MKRPRAVPAALVPTMTLVERYVWLESIRSGQLGSFVRAHCVMSQMGQEFPKKKLVPDSRVVSALTHELSVSTELTLDPDSGRYTKSSNEDATRMESPSNLTCSARCLLHVSS
jgi:hypothetical protein